MMVINFKLKSLDGAAVGQGTGIANVGPGIYTLITFFLKRTAPTMLTSHI